MINTDEAKRLMRLLREARRKEPDQDVRLFQTFGGVLFSRKRDRDSANEPATDPFPVRFQIINSRSYP